MPGGCRMFGWMDGWIDGWIVCGATVHVTNFLSFFICRVALTWRRRRGRSSRPGGRRPCTPGWRRWASGSLRRWRASCPLQPQPSLITEDSDGERAAQSACSLMCLSGRSPAFTSGRWRMKIIVQKTKTKKKKKGETKTEAGGTTSSSTSTSSSSSSGSAHSCSPSCVSRQQAAAHRCRLRVYPKGGAFYSPITWITTDPTLRADQQLSLSLSLFFLYNRIKLYCYIPPPRHKCQYLSAYCPRSY